MSVFGDGDQKVGHCSLEDLLAEKCSFQIPPYQRGYRWQESEVQALIDDLSAYAEDVDKCRLNGGLETKKDYCLQPLVIQPVENSLNEYIIVDGQQRLTTLAILLLSGKDINLDNVLREIEDRSSRQDDKKRVWTLRLRDKSAIEGLLSCECRKNAITIANSKENLEKIEKIHANLNKIVFVYYKLNPWRSVADDANARSVFRRINAGKVSLLDSELLRALFLEPGALDESQALDDSGRSEIAAEWEQMQLRLKDDSFWRMFNHDDIPVHRRMDRLFAIAEECEGDKAHSRVAFDKIERAIAGMGRAEKRKELKTRWRNVLSLYWMLQYCYADLRLYHYIGWLRRCTQVTFSSLYKDYKKDRGGFIETLKMKIAKAISLDFRERDFGENGRSDLHWSFDYPKSRETRPLLRCARRRA